MSLFDRLLEMKTRALATNKTSEKLEIVKDYEDLKEVFRYTYETFHTFGITSKAMEKHKTSRSYKLNEMDGRFVALKLSHTDSSFKNFSTFLDKLITRELSGHAALEMAISWCDAFPQYEELFKNIIDRDLKCKITTTAINKAFPGTIKEFNVCLADKFNEKTEKLVGSGWRISKKLDGCRCIMIKKGQMVKFYSRQGHEFTTLEKIRMEVLALCKVQDIDFDFVIDGEICIVDENGKEDFQAIMKEIKKKDHTIVDPRFIVFDMLSIEEFEEAKNVDIYSDRIKNAAEFVKHAHFLTLVDETEYNDENYIEWLQKVEDEGWEGLMLRDGNSYYENKRTKKLLKVKKMHTMELRCTDLHTGPMRIVNKETGLEETVEVMTHITCAYKDGFVDVGSGFSMDQRKYYMENPDEIIGMEIECQYFEETQNKDGGYSLRFPVFKVNYGEKRDL